jgi:hypothetical protein
MTALITLAEAAKLIPGADENTLKRMARAGTLTVYKPGKKHLTTAEHVLEAVQICRALPSVVPNAEPAHEEKLNHFSPEEKIRAMVLRLCRAQPCVYFVKFGNFIKIGWSNKCLQRFEQLDIYPEPIDVLLVVPGRAAKERYCHNLFGHLRVRKEIFKYESELFDFIQEGRRVLRDVAARA